jgi:hypothetical protein
MSEWHTSIWGGVKDSSNEYWYTAMYGSLKPSLIAEKILGKDIDYGRLFTYMYRRFGPSEFGGDSFKEVMRWKLKTKDENVLLLVSPNITDSQSTLLSFGFSVNTNVIKLYNLSREEEITINKLFEDTINDLLTPVCVRDIMINIKGIYNGGVKPVDYFKYSGFGVDHSCFEE